MIGPGKEDFLLHVSYQNVGISESSGRRMDLTTWVTLEKQNLSSGIKSEGWNPVCHWKSLSCKASVLPLILDLHPPSRVPEVCTYVCNEYEYVDTYRWLAEQNTALIHSTSIPQYRKYKTLKNMTATAGIWPAPRGSQEPLGKGRFVLGPQGLYGPWLALTLTSVSRLGKRLR